MTESKFNLSPPGSQTLWECPGTIGISYKRSSWIMLILGFILVLSYIGAIVGLSYFVDIDMPPEYRAGAAIGFAIEILLLHALILALQKALEAEAIAAYALNKLNNVPSEYLGCISHQDFDEQRKKS